MAAVRATVEDRDEMRWVTVVSVGGLVAAGVLAVVGGLPFDLPMPTHAFGWVTPTCGLTRGSTALVRGDPALAWHYNPASFAVVLFGLFGVVRWSVGWLGGRWLTVKVRRNKAWWVAAALSIGLLWAQQMTNAQFIIHARV
jgi:hypothetical protein